MFKRPTILFCIFVATATLFLGGGVKESSAQVTVNFAVQPNQTDFSTVAGRTLNFSLTMAVDSATLRNLTNCGDTTFLWSVFENNDGYTNGVNDPQIRFRQVENMNQVLPVTTVTRNFSASVNTVSSLPAIRYFYVLLECSGSIANRNLTTSSNTPVAHVPGSGGGNNPPIPGQEQNLRWQLINPFIGGGVNPQNIILRITTWITNIALALIVILIIYAGVRFMLAAGRPGEIAIAKKILFWALMGFAVTLIGRGFISLLISVLEGNTPTF